MNNRRFNAWNWEGPRKGKMTHSWATRYHDFMYWRDKNPRRDMIEHLELKSIIFEMNIEKFNYQRSLDGGK